MNFTISSTRTAMLSNIRSFHARMLKSALKEKWTQNQSASPQEEDACSSKFPFLLSVILHTLFVSESRNLNMTLKSETIESLLPVPAVFLKTITSKLLSTQTVHSPSQTRKQARQWKICTISPIPAKREVHI